VVVEWHDARFHPRRLDLWKTEAQWGGQEVVHKLIPPLPKHIRGRVTFQDTGKPAAGVKVRTGGRKTTTDKQGRFRLKPEWEVTTTLDDVTVAAAWVEVDAPAGSAYLGWRERTGPGRFLKRDGTLGPYLMGEVKIALPRGRVVRGHMREAGTNKAIPGAWVSFNGKDVKSGPDGAFSLTTVGRPGHLIVKAGADYAPAEAMIPWGRAYAHAIVSVDFKKGKDAKPLQIFLRRGVTVKGKLTGPDGKPVKGAVLISRLTITQQFPPPSPVREVPVAAEFELRGCHPEKAYPVVFFHEKKGWGALVQVSGKQAGKLLKVRLRPCGAARARFRTADGRPVVGRRTSGDLQMVLAAGDVVFWGNFVEHSNVRKDWYTDARGRVTWRGLVPGVTYRVGKRTFTVRPGEVRDLGDVK
jgi:hypothetical protein